MQPGPFAVCAASLYAAVHITHLAEAFQKGREGWVELTLSRIPAMPRRRGVAPDTSMGY